MRFAGQPRVSLVRRGVDVHLRGVEALVAQNVLDLAGAGAVLGQARGHGVAEGVHQCTLGDPGVDAGPTVGLADQVLGVEEDSRGN